MSDSDDVFFSGRILVHTNDENKFKNESKSRYKSKDESKNESKNESKTRSKSKDESKNESKTRSKSKDESKTRSKSKDESKTRSKSKDESKDESKTRSKSKDESKTRSKSKNESKTRSKSKDESKTRSKSKNESKTRSKSKDESKNENKEYEKGTYHWLAYSKDSEISKYYSYLDANLDKIIKNVKNNNYNNNINIPGYEYVDGSMYISDEVKIKIAIEEKRKLDKKLREEEIERKKTIKKDKNKNKNDNKKDILDQLNVKMNEIILAKNISSSDAVIFVRKGQDLTETEKIQLDKYKFKKLMGVEDNDLTSEFMLKYYEKANDFKALLLLVAYDHFPEYHNDIPNIINKIKWVNQILKVFGARIKNKQKDIDTDTIPLEIRNEIKISNALEILRELIEYNEGEFIVIDDDKYKKNLIIDKNTKESLNDTKVYNNMIYDFMEKQESGIKKPKAKKTNKDEEEKKNKASFNKKIISILKKFMITVIIKEAGNSLKKYKVSELHEGVYELAKNKIIKVMEKKPKRLI